MQVCAEPAAYLVELMEFLDTDDAEHEKSPLEILQGRRPDLQHLLLSCENTNVALSYVDLVNEVLEHYVVHGSLVGFTGHDTDAEATTADLLADPQFVLDAAYDVTLAEVSPGGLPFDMPLAHLRLLFQVWDTTLADALTLLGSAADARRERLGFGGVELRLLTDTTFHEVAEYFGEPAGTSIDALNDAVASGKEFCRRTDITYAELAQLLTSRFVNPAVRLVPLVDGLGLTMEQVSQHASGALTDDQIRDLLPDDFDEEPYGGDAVAWLSANEAKLLGLIVLTGVDGDGDKCDFGAVQLRYANPEMTANRLTDLSYHRLNRFIRIWKKLGWSIELTDQAVIRFLGLGPDAVTLGNLDATCISLLARLANFRTLLERRSVTPKRVPDWLALWDGTVDVGLRRDRLAALLKFGTTDLAGLVRITGVDPFADDLDDDVPSALRFEAYAAIVKTSPFKVVDLDYLLRRDDVTGKLAPREADQLRDLLALRDGLWAVEADLAVAPDTADLATAQAKVALVYDAATVARFFGLIDRTTTYSVPLITAETSLPAPLAALDTVLAIDPFGQALTHRGVLADPTRAALAAAAAALTLDDVTEITAQGDLEQFVTDLTAALQQLRDAGEADLDALDADHPELRTLYDRVRSETQPAIQAATIVTAILPDLRATLRAAPANRSRGGAEGGAPRHRRVDVGRGRCGCRQRAGRAGHRRPPRARHCGDVRRRRGHAVPAGRARHRRVRAIGPRARRGPGTAGREWCGRHPDGHGGCLRRGPLRGTREPRRVGADPGGADRHRPGGRAERAVVVADAVAGQAAGAARQADRRLRGADGSGVPTAAAEGRNDRRQAGADTRRDRAPGCRAGGHGRLPGRS